MGATWSSEEPHASPTQETTSLMTTKEKYGGADTETAGEEANHAESHDAGMSKEFSWKDVLLSARLELRNVLTHDLTLHHRPFCISQEYWSVGKPFDCGQLFGRTGYFAASFSVPAVGTDPYYLVFNCRCYPVKLLQSSYGERGLASARKQKVRQDDGVLGSVSNLLERKRLQGDPNLLFPHVGLS